ncbi:hypothetical protein [Nakamurella endophytica]|uniref:Uncharacterized protein n=1 Tax=Nakamurella endophytica TaxID=1748367 RepID=A0A917T8U6_9ACTN|nr:hypothetical protein [Nakamurella endophytica]GGM11993.1 hypothetical protein GCM10011594_34800 [Nakamurella endophytica]
MASRATWSLSSGRPRPVLHEVWLELCSGSRVVVGRDLPDVAAANAVASRWIALARDRPDDLHETGAGSGCVVRGSAVVAVKAQHQPTGGRLRGPREGVWL